ncbi:MAG TPA: hypothetical protein DCS93_29855 [Microscillaceae bacterium]|nr:hypothetical protein [Microscillaceae bacterium]
MDNTLLQNRNQASNLIKVLWVALAYAFFTTVINLVLLDGTNVTSMEEVSQDDLLFGAVIGLGTSIISLVCIVFFLIWFYRLYKNLHRSGIHPNRAVGWSIGAFFIPFANWVIPYQIMKEIWYGTQEIGLTEEERMEDKHTFEDRTLLRPWWLTWVISNVVANFYFRKSLNSDVFTLTNEGLTIDIVQNVFYMISAYFLILIVRKLSEFEEKAIMVRQIKEIESFNNEEDPLY